MATIKASIADCEKAIVAGNAFLEKVRGEIRRENEKTANALSSLDGLIMSAKNNASTDNEKRKAVWEGVLSSLLDDRRDTERDGKEKSLAMDVAFKRLNDKVGVANGMLKRQIELIKERIAERGR
ncbi:MAG: hypothetical protein WCJ02_07790 [bacterium]